MLVGLAVLLIVVAVLSFPVVWTVASVLASGPSSQTTLDRLLLLASAFTLALSVLTSLYLGLLAARSRKVRSRGMISMPGATIEKTGDPTESDLQGPLGCEDLSRRWPLGRGACGPTAFGSRTGVH